jgi:maltooligosyltrehalose trehalohydrolase
MGEEYGEDGPFQFFADYSDPELQAAVVEGRKSEFKDFDWDEVPNPQDLATFQRSKLSWKMDDDLLAWYKNLLHLRREFITHSIRTCRARLADGEILLETPAEPGGLKVLISLPDKAVKAISPLEEGDDIRLQSKEDGYSISIFVTKQASTPELLKNAA